MFDAGVGSNIQRGQRTSSIQVSQSATTEAHPLVLEQAYDMSQEEREASRGIDSNIITSKGTSVEKREHLDSGHKIAAPLGSRALTVSISCTISQSNELGLSWVQYNEHAKVAGIIARSLSSQETGNTLAGGNRRRARQSKL